MINSIFNNKGIHFYSHVFGGLWPFEMITIKIVFNRNICTLNAILMDKHDRT